MSNEDYIEKINSLLETLENVLRGPSGNDENTTWIDIPAYKTSDIDSSDLLKKLFNLVIDAGPPISPFLEKMILEEKHSRWVRVFLATIGNEKSIDTLQTGYEPRILSKQKSVDNEMAFIEESLCLARAARKNKEDIKFLISILPKYYYMVLPSAQAELNLVAIRAAEAIPAFKRESERNPKDLYWKDSLERIQTAPARVDVQKLDNSGKELIADVFSNGIPYFFGAQEVFDRKNGGIWKREGNAWIFDTKPVDESVLYYFTIDFDVHISPDNKRSIVRVEQQTGQGRASRSADIYGYEYYLEKKDSSWQIRWLRNTTHGMVTM